MTVEDHPTPLQRPSAEPASPTVVLQTLGWGAPLQWLARGLADMRSAPWVTLFYGLWFWCMALLLAWVFRTKPEYTMSLASGCLLLGPFLAMGLYDTSHRLAAGEGVDLGASITCWDRHMGSMGMLVLVLVILELLWGRASLVVFAVFFNTGMPSTAGVVQAVFNPANWEFILVYVAVGGVFAGLVFASSVVSIPMILDRDTDAMTAAITSMRVVLKHPGVMCLWGAIISALVLASLWWWGVGLVLVGPWLGYASWHAYRAAVEPLPPVPEV
jgi:uncharacterized membrane protein